MCLTDQLERVFLRLGHAETDEQLQDIISKFLPPVLLKLSSVQEGVRKKVRRVLSSSLSEEITVGLCSIAAPQKNVLMSVPPLLGHGVVGPPEQTD